MFGSKKLKDKAIKKPFKDTKAFKALKSVGAGVLSEGASLIPVVGHKIATKIDKVTEKALHQKEGTPKKLGHIIMVALIALYVYTLISGKGFTKEDLIFLINSVKNLF